MTRKMWLNGLKTPNPDYEKIKGQVIDYYKIRSLTPMAIKCYIPYEIGYRVNLLLDLLLVIDCLDRPCIANLKSLVGYNNQSLSKNINFLVVNGFLVEVDRLRLIKVFQKHKIDTGYAITDKARTAIVNIFKDAGMFKKGNRL